MSLCQLDMKILLAALDREDEMLNHSFLVEREETVVTEVHKDCAHQLDLHRKWDDTLRASGVFSLT
jgi:hypothetical protein